MRLAPLVRVRLLVRAFVIGLVTLMSVACVNDAEDIDRVAARGAEEVERHKDDPFFAPISVEGVTLSGEPTLTPAYANNDPGQLFGRTGQTPTTYLALYVLEPDADITAALDDAVSELEQLGARLTSSFEGVREMSATSRGDELHVRLRASATTLRHTVTVSG